MEELQQGIFGPIYTQFKGKPKEAIKFLRQQKQGECPASLHRDDIGDIDIVWGEVTDPVKHKGFGLSHIIDKHETEINQLGFEVEDCAHRSSIWRIAREEIRQKQNHVGKPNVQSYHTKEMEWERKNISPFSF